MEKLDKLQEEMAAMRGDGRAQQPDEAPPTPTRHADGSSNLSPDALPNSAEAQVLTEASLWRKILTRVAQQVGRGMTPSEGLSLFASLKEGLLLLLLASEPSPPPTAADAQSLLEQKFSDAIEVAAGAQLFACVLEALSAAELPAAGASALAESLALEAFAKGVIGSCSDHAHRVPVVTAVKKPHLSPTESVAQGTIAMVV